MVDHMLDNKQVVTVTDSAGIAKIKNVVPLSAPPQVNDVLAKTVRSSENVAKAFTGKRNPGAAITLINQRQPAEVFKRLCRELLYEETREYLVKVKDLITKYEAMRL